MHPSSSVLVVLLVGCAPRASVAPAPPPPIGSNEVARVVASLFPEHLGTIRECRPSQAEPKTWVEIDELERTNLDAGQFVPVVEHCERGHYTDASDQVRCVVRIDNCQPNTPPPLGIEAVFSASALASPTDSRQPTPITVRARR